MSVFIGADAKLIGSPCCVATVKADILWVREVKDGRKSNRSTSGRLLRPKISYVDMKGKGKRAEEREEERNGKKKKQRRNGARLFSFRAGRKSFREIARLTSHRFQFSSFWTRTTINECTASFETLFRLFSPTNYEITKNESEYIKCEFLISVKVNLIPRDFR